MYVYLQIYGILTLKVPAIKGRVISHLEFSQGPCRYTHTCMFAVQHYVDDIRHDCLLPGRGTSCPVHRDMRAQVPQPVEA